MSDHLKEARTQLYLSRTEHQEPRIDLIDAAIVNLLAHLESAAEVPPHRHHPFGMGAGALCSLPIPEPMEETPQSGHTCPASVPVNQDITDTPPIPVTGIGERISSTWEHGALSEVWDFPLTQAQPSRTTAPTSSTRAEEASRGRSVSTGDDHQHAWRYGTTPIYYCESCDATRPGSQIIPDAHEASWEAKAELADALLRRSMDGLFNSFHGDGLDKLLSDYEDYTDSLTQSAGEEWTPERRAYAQKGGDHP